MVSDFAPTRDTGKGAILSPLLILQTPLFRVRNKKTTIYCYSEQEKQNAIEKIGKNFEITRFKGLGEISPNEFKNFIGKDMRLDPVIINKETSLI